MSLKLITAPTIEPVTLARAKSHLRIDHDTEDGDIGGLISGAREDAEHELQRALCPQTWERVLDCFPSGAIKLAYAPITSVTSVKYLDATGTQQTLDPSAWVLDNDDEPGWVRPAYGTDWPASLDTANAVRVRYVCGYASGQCPQSIQHWILLRIGILYHNREAVELPYVAGLLDRYKVYG